MKISEGIEWALEEGRKREREKLAAETPPTPQIGAPPSSIATNLKLAAEKIRNGVDVEITDLQEFMSRFQ